MKKVKKLVAFIMSACMVCAVPTVVAGCNKDGDGTHNSQTQDAVKVKDGTDISVNVGGSKTVTVSEYVTANGNTVSVNSSNPAVAEAKLNDGVVTVLGKAKGTANVKITCGGVEVTFHVNVSAATEKPAPVFEDLTASFVIGKDTSIEVPLAPKSGGEGFTCTYSLASGLIEGAEITGNKLTFTTDTAGDVEISVVAKCTDNDNPQTVYEDITFKVKISVTENSGPEYYTVTIDGESRQVAHGATVKLPDKPKQEIPEGKQFKGWQVGAEVKSGGSSIVVTGPLEITAVIEDAPQAAPEKIKDGEAVSFRIAEGGSTFDVADYITTNGHAVSVSSSSEEVATVSESSGVVEITAVAAGITVVTLTCKDIEITFDVTIKNAVPAFENGTLNIDKFVSATAAYEIKPNGADTYSYEYSVSGATVEDGVLSYTATDTGTATLTVNVTATDSATGEVEHTSFTVEVTVTDSTAYQIVNGSFDTWEDGKPKGWTVTEDYGSEQTASTYWDPAQEFDNIGSYFGEPDENKTGTLQSPQFIVGNSGWITFQLGGGHPDSDIYVEVVNAADNSTVAKFRNFNWSDPDNALRLIPYKVDLSGFKGESVYIKVVDNQAAGNMGFRTFYADEFRSWYDSEPATVKADNGRTLTFVNLGAPVFKDINQTLDLKEGNRTEVTLPEMLFGINSPCTYTTSAEGAEINGNKLIYNATESGVHKLNVTGTTKYGSSTFTVVISVINSNYSIVNGGFETGDLTGWTLTNLDGSEFAVDASWQVVQNTNAYWGNTAAYNNTGYHFNGQEGGIPENLTYKLTSSVFTLGGSGFISFKIGGHAAVVKIYDEATNTLLAQYSNTAYADHDIGHIELGARQATMTTYVADLSEHLGKNLYLVLEDNMTGDWGHAIMDDVVTYYETAPSVNGRFDTVTNFCEHGGTTQIAWVQAVNEHIE